MLLGDLGLVIDLGVKITQALKVIAQAAVALVEQIFVDAAFLKDGDEMLDAIRFEGSALDFDLDDGAAIGGEAIVDGFGGAVILRGFELDVGFKPALPLELAEHAIEGAIDGIVVDMSANPQPGVAEECLEAHAGVARDRNLPHARPDSRDHAKSDIGELLIGVRRNGLRDRRFKIAVLLKRGAHLIHSAQHFGLRQAGSGFELRGALELRVHRRPDGSVDSDRPDESARGSEKDQRHAARLARTLDFDSVIEAARVELPEAPFHVVGGQRGAFRLRQVVGERG